MWVVERQGSKVVAATEGEIDQARGKRRGNAKKILKWRERTQSSVANQGLRIFGVHKTNWFLHAKYRERSGKTAKTGVRCRVSGFWCRVSGAENRGQGTVTFCRHDRQGQDIAWNGQWTTLVTSKMTERRGNVYEKKER
jgi:hypothetical protein